MTPRLLFSGHSISYGRLLELRGQGEVIIASNWRDCTNMPHLWRIATERDYIIVAGQTKHGFYYDLRWYGSVTGSLDPADYNML